MSAVDAVAGDAPSPVALRIEIGAPVGSEDPARYRAATVVDDAATASAAVLRVDADGTVHVTGWLDVDGQISEGPVPGDPQDPSFAAAVAEGVEAGISGRPAAALSATITGPADVVVGVTAEYTARLVNTGTDTLAAITIHQVSPGAQAIGLPTGTTLADGQAFDVIVSFKVTQDLITDGRAAVMIQIQVTAEGAAGRRAVAHAWTSVPVIPAPVIG